MLNKDNTYTKMKGNKKAKTTQMGQHGTAGVPMRGNAQSIKRIKVRITRIRNR